MSHKAAKKVRKLLAQTMGTENGNPFQARDYTENANRRKKQLVELKDGGKKEIEVSLGQLTLKQGTGRSVYKLVKNAMKGKGSSQRPVRAPVANKTKGAELLAAPTPTFIEDPVVVTKPVGHPQVLNVTTED